MKGSRAFTALLLAAVMILGNALAGTYYIEDGDIEVHALETSQAVTQADRTQNDNAPVISNRDPETPSTNTVTIKADDGCTASVTVKDLNIDVNEKRDPPAVKTEGAGNVDIELDGNNCFISGGFNAGLQKENTGNLTINDTDQNGKVEAKGGQFGAGIGGGNEGAGCDITINGGEVTATGGFGGAGIGGGFFGVGHDITIEGGKVTATGDAYGAGIGGGFIADGYDVTIEGGEVTAIGGICSAGIGGGFKGAGHDITVSGGEVTATGGHSGAGIGGGGYGAGYGIAIEGGEVTATGGEAGAGIGGGNSGKGSNINISGGEVTATGGDCGAGIGGGSGSGGHDITIEGGEVTATGGEAGAGIGGGADFGNAAEVKNITIRDSALVKAAGGGMEDTDFGQGAAIGTGGSYEKTNGSEIEFEKKDLTCGSIEYYAPGTSAEDIQNSMVDPEETVKGTKEHDVSSDWTGNSKTHWHPCTERGCAARIDEAAHTPGERVIENEKPAQAGKAGSYDEVIYCSVCHRELSRKTVTTAPLRDNKKMPQGNLAALCAEMAKQIRQAPENGTVEMDAGSFDGLTRVVFKALGERPDVTLKLQTKEGVITIPAGAGLLEKIGGKNKISFAELKDMIR